MNILTHKSFDKAFRKVPPKVRTKFYQRIEIFMQNEFGFRLRNHALSGKYSGTRSIDITGDWRVLYERVDKDTALLMGIGTHSQLYG